MEGLNSINKGIAYIEDHLTTEIHMSKAAQTACLSEYQFSRMFSSLTGVTLSEYVRRRRLTLAAYDIQNTKERVLDIALKYGYESADAFTRAFHKIHGVNPSEARKQGVKLIAYPRLSFSINVHGETEISYRVEEIQENFYVAGQAFEIQAEKAVQEIPEIWQKLLMADDFGQMNRFYCKQMELLDGVLGVYGQDANKEYGKYDYLIGVVSGRLSEEALGKASFTQIEVKAGKWLVFTELTHVREKLFSEWIPTLGYELDDRSVMECVYSLESKRKTELWVPIK